MIKSMNQMAPAALCLAFAAGLVACKDNDVSTQAKAAGSNAEVTQEAAPPTPPAPLGSEGEVSASASAGPTAEPATMGAAGGAAGQGAITSLRPIGEASDRAATDSGGRRAHREPVVVAQPAVLDFGELATGERRTAPLRLENTSDTVVRLVNSRTSCGCTVANVPRNYDMAPGESVEVDVSLSGGHHPTRLTKTVTFIFEDHPNVMVNVSGDVVAYITMEPRVLDPETNADGRIIVRSHDGEPFRVTGVVPQIIAELPDEAAAEHELYISWEQWSELRQPRRLELTIDHPKTQKVAASIRNPTRSPSATDLATRDRQTGAQQQPRPASLYDLAQRGEADAILDRIRGGEEVDSTDPRGMSLLGVAARHGHVELMRALIEAGADVNHVAANDGLTPLMSAAQSKNAQTVRLLLEAGADLHSKDFTLGNTALSWAALSGDAETVQTLLNAGAEVEIVARITGYTPLTWAAGFGESGSVRLLLEAGAEREIACQVQGATPIMYAASTGRVDNVKILLEAGVNLEAKDNRGRTVFVFAAGQSGADAATIEALIDGGANVTAIDPNGRNALDHARTRGDVRRDDVIRVLQPYFE